MWMTRRVHCDDTDGVDGNGQAGGAAPAGDAASAAGGGSAGAQTPGGATAQGMLAEIERALKYEPGQDGTGPKNAEPGAGAGAGAGADGTVKPTESAEAKEAREKAAAEHKVRKDLEAKAAAGDEAAKRELAATKEGEDKKPKDLKALELTSDERRLLNSRTAQRYNEVLGIAKTERARAEAAQAQVEVLATARDGILTVLQETNTSDEDLAQLLEYNRLTKTGRPAELEAALQILNAQRANLMRALGKAGDGEDPLAAHPDLSKDLEDEAITRERALEIAEARRREAVARRTTERDAATSRASSEQAARTEQESTVALVGIEKWSKAKAAGDLDFNAKQDILLPRLGRIINNYPPGLWLQRIQEDYDLIAVPKPAPLPAAGDDRPLRPSGAKPGAPAPTSALEAIEQGLGYARSQG